jgi:hypothetical protein
LQREDKDMPGIALQDDNKPAALSYDPQPVSAVTVERLRIVNANAPAARAERDTRATEMLLARVGKRHPWTEDGA